MRSQKEINGQIEGLEKMKEWLPEFSVFGTPNHLIIDAQISILDYSSELSDFEEGNLNEMDDENQIYRGAEDAEAWLNEENDEDLFEEKEY